MLQFVELKRPSLICTWQQGAGSHGKGGGEGGLMALLGSRYLPGPSCPPDCVGGEHPWARRPFTGWREVGMDAGEGGQRGCRKEGGGGRRWPGTTTLLASQLAPCLHPSCHPA